MALPHYVISNGRINHHAEFERKELIGNIYKSKCGKEFYIGFICRFGLHSSNERTVNCKNCLKAGGGK